MTNDQIKEIALASGFKLKEQPDGTQDLNPYVYEFSRALITEQNKKIFSDIQRLKFIVNDKSKPMVLKAVDDCLNAIQASQDKIYGTEAKDD